MNILAIDTSCDETAAAVTSGTKVLSNIIWSQASAHAKFGGVLPSLAQRIHEERIDWVVAKALTVARMKIETDIDAIAVTLGPGLSIALGVGIKKAQDLSIKYDKKLIGVNHTESHLLSALASKNTRTQSSNSAISFPALGLVVSGKNTQLVLISKIGRYKILAETEDDALGEALDKSARLLGFGYPGGAILEKIAREGRSGKFALPLPLVSDRIKNRFSYSGIKTAFVRLVTSINDPTKEQIADLAASFQATAFEHILKVVQFQIENLKNKESIRDFLLGGGVANNILLRNMLRKLLRNYEMSLRIPYSDKLLADNAAMIGVTAGLKLKDEKYIPPQAIDRNPRYRITD